MPLSWSIILIFFLIKWIGFLNEYDWIFFNSFGFKINFSISSKIDKDDTFLRKIGLSIVSGRPPRLDKITALPLEPDSNEDLPNGSSQREGTIVIDDLL